MRRGRLYILHTTKTVSRTIFIYALMKNECERENMDH